MKFVNQSFSIVGTPLSVDDAWKFVAAAARNCYQSSKVNTQETEEDFCRRILLKHEDTEKNHMSPFEFGVIYLDPNAPHEIINKYVNNKYSAIRCFGNLLYVTTNLRVIIEHNWESDLQYAIAPTVFHELACCFHMITSLHVYKDLTRHRTLSFAIESTRYCKYTSKKFGAGLTFIYPIKLKPYSKDLLCIDSEGYWDGYKYNADIENKPKDASLLLKGLKNDELTYQGLIDCGWTAQEAATKLPQDIKASVYMCGYKSNLDHMFKLRAEECSGSVLPQVAEITKPMYQEYIAWEDSTDWMIENNINKND